MWTNSSNKYSIDWAAKEAGSRFSKQILILLPLNLKKEFAIMSPM